MRRHPWLLVWCLVGAGAPSLWAEDALSAEPGSRVRLTASAPPATLKESAHAMGREAKPLIGVLVTADAEALTVKLDGGEGQQRIPRSSIRTLELSTGKRSAWRTGALVGAAFGAVLIYTEDPCPELEADCPLNAHVSERLAGAAVGALAYGLAGAGIGSFFKTDRWHPLPLDAIRLAIAPTRGRGIHLSVSVGF